MPLYTDQLGRSILLPATPQRIISLVPSQTELLAYLGLNQEVIGITKFCIHPEEWFRTKTRIGGTKTVNMEKIRSLQPDLIIANKEENVQAQVEELGKEFPVWVSDVNNINEAYAMITGMGSITNKVDKANTLVQQLKTSFASTPYDKVPAAYLIWREPYMTVGGDTFIHQMMMQAGFENVFKQKERYPQIRISDLQDVGCEWILLSSEPYPFSEKHIAELQFHLPNSNIILVDGELFSWYGSRLLHSASYFADLQRKIAART